MSSDSEGDYSSKRCSQSSSQKTDIFQTSRENFSNLLSEYNNSARERTLNDSTNKLKKNDSIAIEPQDPALHKPKSKKRKSENHVVSPKKSSQVFNKVESTFEEADISDLVKNNRSEILSSSPQEPLTHEKFKIGALNSSSPTKKYSSPVKQVSSSKKRKLSVNSEELESEAFKDIERQQSLEKISSENGMLKSLREDSNCFIVRLPVGINPESLAGNTINLTKKSKVKVEGKKFYATPVEENNERVTFAHNNQLLNVPLTHTIEFRSKSKDTVNPINLVEEEDDIIESLISAKVASMKEPKKVNLDEVKAIPKTPTKNNKAKKLKLNVAVETDRFLEDGANLVEQTNRWLKDGAKFLNEAKTVCSIFKEEKMRKDLDDQTNTLLQQQLDFFKQNNEDKNRRKQLEQLTRTLLAKRTSFFKSHTYETMNGGD